MQCAPIGNHGCLNMAVNKFGLFVFFFPKILLKMNVDHFLALANCERYEAKGTKFRQYFPLDDPHSQASGPLLYSFTFASIADQTVRVELSEGDDRPIPRPGNNLPEGFIEEEEEWETSTYSAFPEERDPPPRYEDRFYVKYEIGKMAIISKLYFKINKINLNLQLLDP